MYDINDGGLYRLLLDAIGAGEGASRVLLLLACVFAAAIGYFAANIPTRVKFLAEKPTAAAFCKAALAIAVSGLFFGFGYVGGISVEGYAFVPCHLAAFFAQIGETFPLIDKKRQAGSGVGSLAASALILSPAAFGITALSFLLLLALTKYLSLSVVTAALIYPVALNGCFSFLFGKGRMPGLMTVVVMAGAVMILWFYRENLGRISSRAEPRTDLADFFRISKNRKNPKNPKGKQK